MKNGIKEFRVKHGDTVDLKQWPTRIEPLYDSKAEYKKHFADEIEKLSKLQERLYANHREAVLVIFQAMDTAGKDGAIKHVMSGVNPQGCRVSSFKHPSATELAHDFLWRTAQELPERGMIGIHNRSQYEEVLIVRVHPEILKAENLPAHAADDAAIWKKRFQSINEFEQHLHRNGTRVVKIFLHISKDEQRARLLDRIDTPDKNWKMQAGDLKERKYWKQYRKAYEECIEHTTTREAPWYIVPADDKPTARLLVSRIVIDTLSGIDLDMPEATLERLAELKSLRAALESD